MVLFAAAITGGATAQAQERPALPVVAAADNRPDIRALSFDERQELQAEIDEVLAETDNGGVQISANEISWNGGEPILAFPLPGETEAPPSSAAALRAEGLSATADVEPLVNWEGCPAGNDDSRWYCFYQYSNFGGAPTSVEPCALHHGHPVRGLRIRQHDHRMGEHDQERR